MKKYDDLELSILSCLLQKPELMKKVKIEDKYFINHGKIWLFMKSFYKKFGNFDPVLMVNISNNKYRIIEYILWLLEKEPSPSLFDIYQQELINKYNELKKEKMIKSIVYELSNDLYIGNIEIEEFKNRIKKVFKEYEEM